MKEILAKYLNIKKYYLINTCKYKSYWIDY